MGDALLTGCTATCGTATIFFEMCQYQRLPLRLDIGRSLPALWRVDSFWRRCVSNDWARIDDLNHRLRHVLGRCGRDWQPYQWRKIADIRFRSEGQTSELH